MSERQEDKRRRQEEQALAMRMQQWAGQDPALIERWAGGVPAGFGGTSFTAYSPSNDPDYPDEIATNIAQSWVPGQVMTKAQVDEVIANLRGDSPNTRGVIGGQGMTLDSYLADPRAAIKVENGQYVFRPGMESDFLGINPTGFWDGMGPAALVAGLAGGLPMLTSMGVLGGGAAAAGGAEAAGAGASGAGGFSSSFAPTITPSTVAQSGLLYSGGSMPTVAGLSGVGGLTAEGMAALGAMGSAGAGLGAGTTGALGSLGLDAAGNIVPGMVDLANSGSMLSTIPATTGLPSTPGMPSTSSAPTTPTTSTTPTTTSPLQKFLKDTLGLDVDQNMLSMLGQLGGAGIGLLGSKQQSDALKDLQAQMSGQRAPFLNKAVGYLNNPESFYTSPEATGAANATMRALSTQFGNPGTSPTAQGLATGALYDRYSNTVNSLGSLGLSGQGIQANLGQQIASTSRQPYAIAGNTISGLTSDNSMDEMLKRMFSQQFSLN
jgi:hypothetical protein